ncbi:MAG: hypothetical protein ACTMIR_09010 [Cellulomonadaceae bacterium]
MAPAQTSDVTHAGSRHPIATWLALGLGAVTVVALFGYRISLYGSPVLG